VTRRRYIFDASAIVALFQGHPEAGDFLAQAERGELPLTLPAVAIADANATIRGNFNTWEAVFLTPNVHAAELSEFTAIEIGTWPGGLQARQAMFEARETQGVVVTQNPDLYPPGAVALLVI
jgi:hypothetical protein